MTEWYRYEQVSDSQSYRNFELVVVVVVRTRETKYDLEFCNNAWFRNVAIILTFCAKLGQTSILLANAKHVQTV